MWLNKFRAYNPQDPQSFDRLTRLIRGELYFATPQELNDPHEIFDKSSGVRICSFTKGSNSNLLLWIHYANSFNGIAVEFDRDKIQQKINEINTNLNPRIEIIDIKYVKKINLDDHASKYREKYFQWHYEDETRLMVSDKNDAYTIEVTPKKVMIGFKFVTKHQDEYDSIKKICVDNSIPFETANKQMAIYNQDVLFNKYKEQFNKIENENEND